MFYSVYTSFNTTGWVSNLIYFFKVADKCMIVFRGSDWFSGVRDFDILSCAIVLLTAMSIIGDFDGNFNL